MSINTLEVGETLKLQITTYEGFRTNWYERNPKLRQRTFDKILLLRASLSGKDPISYLYGLYFDKKMSLDEILVSEHIQEINFISKATLARLLFGEDGLNWEARAKTERTPVHERLLDEQIETRIQQFDSQVSALLQNKTGEKIFSMQQLQLKTYRIQKALYILSSLGGIDKNTLYRLSVEGGLDDATISHALNKKLEEVLSQYPELQIDLDEVKLYPQSIRRWVHYQNQKNQDSSHL